MRLSVQFKYKDSFLLNKLLETVSFYQNNKADHNLYNLCIILTRIDLVISRRYIESLMSAFDHCDDYKMQYQNSLIVLHGRICALHLAPPAQPTV